MINDPLFQILIYITRAQLVNTIEQLISSAYQIFLDNSSRNSIPFDIERETLNDISSGLWALEDDRDIERLRDILVIYDQLLMKDPDLISYTMVGDVYRPLKAALTFWEYLTEGV